MQPKAILLDLLTTAERARLMLIGASAHQYVGDADPVQQLTWSQPEYALRYINPWLTDIAPAPVAKAAAELFPDKAEALTNFAQAAHDVFALSRPENMDEENPSPEAPAIVDALNRLIHWGDKCVGLKASIKI